MPDNWYFKVEWYTIVSYACAHCCILSLHFHNFVSAIILIYGQTFFDDTLMVQTCHCKNVWDETKKCWYLKNQMFGNTFSRSKLYSFSQPTSKPFCLAWYYHIRSKDPILRCLVTSTHLYFWRAINGFLWYVSLCFT